MPSGGLGNVSLFRRANGSMGKLVTPSFGSGVDACSVECVLIELE